MFFPAAFSNKTDVTKIAVNVVGYQKKIEREPAEEIMVKSCNSWQGRAKSIVRNYELNEGRPLSFLVQLLCPILARPHFFSWGC
jgi:hypothetical protein